MTTGQPTTATCNATMARIKLAQALHNASTARIRLSQALHDAVTAGGISAPMTVEDFARQFERQDAAD